MDIHVCKTTFSPHVILASIVNCEMKDSRFSLNMVSTEAVGEVDKVDVNHAILFAETEQFLQED